MVAEIPAIRAVNPVAVTVASGAEDRNSSPLMKKIPIPMISTKGMIFRAVMTVWNLPPPSTERRCIIIKISTKATATRRRIMPCTGIKNAR